LTCDSLTYLPAPWRARKSVICGCKNGGGGGGGGGCWGGGVGAPPPPARTRQRHAPRHGARAPRALHQSRQPRTPHLLEDGGVLAHHHPGGPAARLLLRTVLLAVLRQRTRQRQRRPWRRAVPCRAVRRRTCAPADTPQCMRHYATPCRPSTASAPV
jgi:hypothetical protein